MFDNKKTQSQAISTQELCTRAASITWTTYLIIIQVTVACNEMSAIKCVFWELLKFFLLVKKAVEKVKKYICLLKEMDIFFGFCYLLSFKNLIIGVQAIPLFSVKDLEAISSKQVNEYKVLLIFSGTKTVLQFLIKTAWRNMATTDLRICSL